MRSQTLISSNPPQSPLKGFVDTLTLIARNRRMIKGLVGSVSDWPSVLEDLEMMLHEGVIVGLRSRWVRRVAVPIFQASRALAGDAPLDVRKVTAMEILDQCIDEALRVECQSWIRLYAA